MNRQSFGARGKLPACGDTPALWQRNSTPLLVFSLCFGNRSREAAGGGELEVGGRGGARAREADESVLNVLQGKKHVQSRGDCR